ncbi:hypothetical protein AYR62_06985 [Secundilactobacillus paracollinoides]|uniref:5-formyltetrahydrofolate cyclo-ligase n=1 Tax=Secundilactobacillus paracollinoides TaxID=240427 RepID=UPI00081A324C|nr:5-formyltetrahydrofolate cyclo-ligase [Secundilactobacillus paracollinoides]ANZ63861.1 hypothetical protein AYR62_06985 [Secundilactobacillus paracollinoides]
MKKKALREQIIANLTALSTDVRHFQADELYQDLFASHAWNTSHTVAVTMSTETELDTQPIIEAAQQADKRVLVPRTFPGRQMEFVPLTDAVRLETSEYGIEEPVNGNATVKSAIDLIVVPGLGFTPAGDRLGFGGGYYDRYLADYSGQTVSLALDAQLFDTPQWSVKEHDIRVQQVITVH